MNVRYRITLAGEERIQLEPMVQGGKVAVRKLKRAQVLLAAAEGARIDWMFTLDRAREKLGKAYPIPASRSAQAAA